MRDAGRAVRHTEVLRFRRVGHQAAWTRRPFSSALVPGWWPRRVCLLTLLSCIYAQWRPPARACVRAAKPMTESKKGRGTGNVGGVSRYVPGCPCQVCDTARTSSLEIIGQLGDTVSARSAHGQRAVSRQSAHGQPEASPPSLLSDHGPASCATQRTPKAWGLFFC